MSDLEIEIAVEPFTHDHPDLDSPFWEVVVRSTAADYTWGAWTDTEIADAEARKLAGLLGVVVGEPIKVDFHATEEEDGCASS